MTSQTTDKVQSFLRTDSCLNAIAISPHDGIIITATGDEVLDVSTMGLRPMDHWFKSSYYT